MMPRWRRHALGRMHLTMSDSESESWADSDRHGDSDAASVTLGWTRKRCSTDND